MSAPKTKPHGLGVVVVPAEGTALRTPDNRRVLREDNGTIREVYVSGGSVRYRVAWERAAAEGWYDHEVVALPLERSAS